MGATRMVLGVEVEVTLQVFKRGDIVRVNNDFRPSDGRFITGSGMAVLCNLKPGMRYKVIKDGTIDSVEVEEFGDPGWYGTQYATV